MIFRDRRDGGVALARIMKDFRDWGNAIVLALPRGGVPVAFEVANALDLPLDILVVRKLGVPGYEELAMGAIASGGTIVVNEAVIREFDISREALEDAAQREKLEIERREVAYRGGRPPLQTDGRVVIAVDDGLATGASMLAAVRALRPRARQVIAAIPVAAREVCRELSREADEVICAATPRRFIAVGMYYRHFEPTSDEEIRDLLAQSRNDAGA